MPQHRDRPCLLRDQIESRRAAMPARRVSFFARRRGPQRLERGADGAVNVTAIRGGMAPQDLADALEEDRAVVRLELPQRREEKRTLFLGQRHGSTGSTS